MVKLRFSQRTPPTPSHLRQRISLRPPSPPVTEHMPQWPPAQRSRQRGRPSHPDSHRQCPVLTRAPSAGASAECCVSGGRPDSGRHLQSAHPSRSAPAACSAALPASAPRVHCEPPPRSAAGCRTRRRRRLARPGRGLD